jgi:hypothetical protein
VGEPRNVGEAIVEHLFGDATGRMPIVGISGKHGTTMTARLIAWLLQISGKKTGLTAPMACSSMAASCRGWPERLGNRRAPAAQQERRSGVFESSARMILSEGLAYDKCAVGVVTDVSDFEDVSDFHIDSADKLYNVLRTQVDVVLPSGAAVLNAADPQVVEMADLCDGEVIFYGADEQLAAIAAHRKDGKRVVFQRADGIVMAHGERGSGQPAAVATGAAGSRAGRDCRRLGAGPDAGADRRRPAHLRGSTEKNTSLKEQEESYGSHTHPRPSRPESVEPPHCGGSHRLVPAGRTIDRHAGRFRTAPARASRPSAHCSQAAPRTPCRWRACWKWLH